MAFTDNERYYLHPPRARGSGSANTSARAELVLRLAVVVTETISAR
jgi:hypothetical protein